MADFFIIIIALIFGFIILGGIKFLLSVVATTANVVVGTGIYEKTDDQTKAYLVKASEQIHDPDSALKEIDKAITNDPKYKLGYFCKAIILFEMQRYGETIQAIRNYKEIDKSFVEKKEHVERLKIVEIASLIKLGDKQTANIAYSDALKNDRSFKHRMLAYSKVDFEGGSYRSAADIAFALIHLSELDWYSSKDDEFYLGQYYLYLGKALAKMNKNEEAINELDEAISLLDNTKYDHRYETVHYLYEEKGDILSENNQYMEALRAYDKCLEIEQYPNILEKKQKILERQQNHQ